MIETKILCVDDEKSILKLLTRILEKNGFNYITSDNPIDARELFDVFKPDIVLLDIMMPGISGNELLVYFMTQQPRCKVIMITAHPSAANVHHALRTGAFDFIVKPFKIEYLLNCITRAREMIIAEEEHEQLLRDLDAGTAKIRELMNFKSEFLTRLFHDLKPPTLNAMIQWRKLNFSEGPEFPAIVKKVIGRATEATGQFQVILDNLLEISVLEAGKQKLDLHPVDIKETVRDISQRLDSYRQHLAIELVVRTSQESAVVAGDKRKTSLIFENIILNSLQFTPSGGTVSVDVKRVFYDGVPMIKTVISDTGIGIAQEELQKIFQPGYRIKRTSPHGFQGAGLGLAIVRNLLKSHSGRMSVTSTLGQGTTMSVFIPAITVDAGLHTALSVDDVEVRS